MAGAGARFSGSKGLHALLLLGGSILAASVALANPVLPNGGVVGAGSANIGTGPQQVTVTQSSTRAVIDWSGFSIGSGGIVRFDNGSGATLNRVKGGGVSQIDGLLSASGSVYLINPNGVIVGKSGVVDVGGSFVASTLGIDNDRFMAGGDLSLSSTSTASVVNLGKIGALGGDVVLSAATVSNDGTITAGGAAGLLSGSTVLLRDTATDAGKFAVRVGTSGGSVTNSGAIKAAMAELRANGGNVYALAGNTGGLVQATGVGEKDGKLYLIAEGGDLVAEGTLSARAKGGAGGFVETSGDHVDFTRVSIDTGGGNWLIDPYSLTIDSAAASTISTALATSDVTLKTTATSASGPGVQNPTGVGDITISAPISWASTQSLVLSAYRNINVNAGITDSAAGKVVLRADGKGTGIGTVAFGSGVKVTTPGTMTIYYHPTSYATPTSFGGNLAGGVKLTAYFLVSNLAQLQAVGTNPGAFYYQNANIDASASATINGGQGFIPIGDTAGVYTTSSNFGGIYLGNNFAITGLTINRPATSLNTGLFASVTGTVQDTRLIAANITGGTNTGGIAGKASGNLTGNAVGGTILGDTAVGGVVGLSSGVNNSNTSTAAVTGGNYVGGLVGDAEGNVSNGSASGLVIIPTYTSGTHRTGGGLVGFLAAGKTISNSTASGDVIVGTYAGGLVGESSGTITHSSASGNVTGGQSSGGLVGAQSGGSISYSGASGAVSGIYDTAGLIGTATQTSIDHASATGNVTGRTDNTGGLVGTADAISVTNSFASGAVSAWTGGVGGLIGLIEDGGTVSDSYASGAVTSTDYGAGGLIGTSSDGSRTVTISNVYATGAVTAPYAGGLIAGIDNRTTVTSAYATGLVTGLHAAGLITYNSGTIVSSFWDTTTTGSSAAIYSGSGALGATPLSGTARYQQASYSGFDFTAGTGHWVILEGDTRPILSMEYSNTITNGHALQLAALQPNVAYTVQGEIDLSETANASGIWSAAGFLPIGTDASPFTGSLVADGSAVISGMKIVRNAGGPVGLVGVLGATGSINGIDLVGVNANGTTTTAGALVGTNYGTIANSSSSGVVRGAKAGGLVGWNEGTIADSFSTAAVTGGVNGRAGGLVGYQLGGSVSNSYAGGAVTSTSAGNYAGGLLGWLAGGTVSNVYSTGAVSAVSGSIGGGLIGKVSVTGSTVSLGYASGAVSGAGTLGGLIGEQDAGTSISKLYWDSGTTGQASAIGAIVGGTRSNLIAVGGTSGHDPYAQATYAALNFSGDWAILPGDTRPMLRSELHSRITNLHQLQLLTLSASSGKSYRIAADINGAVVTNASDIWRTSTGFVPIGTMLTPSTISLDGQNHSISNLVINRPSMDLVGLFGFLRSGTIERIKLVGGTVSGRFDSGGLVGWNVAGMIVGVSSSMTVTGTDIIGGLIGQNWGSLLVSSDSGVTSAGAHVGGLVGENLGVIDRSSATGKVTASGNFAGGAVGKNQGSLTRTTASGVVTGNYMVGGLAGANESGAVIAGSQATGAVTGSRWTGGLVGENDGTVMRSWAGGAVKSIGQLTGGLIGKNTGTVSDVYATGKVSGGAMVGGLIGWNTGSTASVIRGYASGAVTGTSGIGGVVGFNDTGATITDFYWDLGTTGVAVAAGLNNGSLVRVTAIGTGTTKPVNTNSSYPSFDFTKIWRSTNSSFGVRPTLIAMP
ncbi:beta strand repeat-containing protein [Sphingomonas sp. MMS24-J13]|uniref:beta strand repeat-containing protein n=1 Tax=Sphingomonas sp. MMS24-J13 TaxID=3238686 RepID=UPI00384EDDD7